MIVVFVLHVDFVDCVKDGEQIPVCEADWSRDATQAQQVAFLVEQRGRLSWWYTLTRQNHTQ